MAKHPNPFTYTYTRAGFDQVHFKRRWLEPKGVRVFDHFVAQRRGEGFQWLAASSDGEPAHDLYDIDWLDVPFPPDDAYTTTDDDFRDFLKQKHSEARRSKLSPEHQAES